MKHMPKWYQQSKAKLAAGDRLGAYEVLVAAGKRGNLEAAATLARYMWGHESEERCVAILEEVSRRISKQNWQAHFALHLAYSIGVGLGVRGHTEIKRRSFESLKAAAKASGDSQMYLSVGLHYWQGLNSVTANAKRAEAWLKAAASSGESEVVSTYKKFLSASNGTSTRVRPNRSLQATASGRA